MKLKNSLVVIGLLGALAFLALLPQSQALTAPKSSWVWLCQTNVAYKWTLGGASTGESTWTFTAFKNISVNVGQANGSISSPSFTSTAGVPLYTLDYGAGTYDLLNSNYLRTGGWIPYTSLSKTFAGGVTGNITYPPTFLEQMTLLNKSLSAYIEGASVWGSGNIDPAKSGITYLTGQAAAWRISYVHAVTPLRMMNWTITVSGVVKDFVETDATGSIVASAAYQYPAVGVFGFDPTVDASIWIGIITICVGIVYTLGTKKQDRQEDAEAAALKKMVAEKAESPPAPKKEGE